MSTNTQFFSQKTTVSLAVLFSFLTPLTLHAAPVPTRTIQANQWALTNQADQAIKKYQSENNVPGMSVAICKNGNFLYSQGFGWSNVEKKIKASQNTRYRLASVSKPVTAILAMELQDQGQLKPNSNIRTLLSGLSAQHSYTLGQLLSHQSGVRHYKSGSDPTKNVNIQFGRAQDALKLFITDPLVMPPGSNYKYSTHGYTVLATAMEKITNKNFGTYASSRFNAWGLQSLRPENSAIQVANRAEIYGTNNKPAKRDNLSWKYAGGGYESSAVDLCKLGMKVLNGNILKPTSRDLMWTKQKSQAGTTQYGFGWSVGQDGNRKVVAHNGAQTGAASYWRIYPSDGVVVVVLSNRRGHNPRNLGISLGKMAVLNTTQFTQQADDTIQLDEQSVDE
ncbi:MAG: beta-lactamase family protein [Goleter apudmare HA4340-LM2]|jgi:CubicO group peptidase (beta-lactamase class C family)|nr:beta-lactamase family protein [Goleter apudmare HA4340-LM2]